MARKTLGILMVLVGFASMTTLLSAHHSRAMYDVEQLVSVEGVVTNVEWRNPHMWITLDVPGPTGKLESWGFEGSGAASMVASGISPQILILFFFIRRSVCHVCESGSEVLPSSSCWW